MTSNWKETTLGEVGRVVTGKTPSRDNPEQWGDMLGFITPSDIKSDSKYIYETERYISQEGLEAFERMVIPRNSIIVTCIGSDMGKVVMNAGDCITNQQINSLIVNDAEYDRNFVYYRLKNSYSLLWMHADGGSTMPILNKSTFEGLKFSFPPLPEQKAIAAILSSFDDKIELLRRQNKTLENIAQTIFKEWFIKFGIQNSEFRINKKTGLPEGWRMGKLAEEFEIIMGQSPDGESYNESGDGMIFFQGRTDFQERFPETRLYTTEPKRIAEKFDVLVSVRAPVGDINVAFDRCCIGRGLAAVRSKYKAYALYKIKSLKNAFDKFEDEGTVFGSIGKDSFANIETIIPDSEAIKAFEAITGSIDAKIYNNYKQIQTISKLRDALLPKLMKGEIKVKA